MKIHLLRLTPLTVVLCAAPVALPAQSEAASTHASRAVQASGTASAETLAAGAHAAAGSIRVVSAVAAVPLWIGGAALSAAGHASMHVGYVSAQAGRHTTRAAADFWQASSTLPAAPAPCATPRRPPLDRHAGLPARPLATPACDPSPAEAFHRARFQ